MAGELTPGILKSFDPPAFLSDLESENLPGWSKIVSDYFESGKAGDENDANDNPRPQFFNATNFPVGEGFVTQDVAWTAFPRRIILAASNDRQRWSAADSDRAFQDEYCEWSVERVGNKITRVTFTCEAPEYFQYLASVQPDTVLQLYREHVSSAVKREDLFNARGEYLVENRWNRDTTNGAMHLVQRNNTLGAQVELAAASTIVRLDSEGQPLTDSTELIRCSRYGDEKRFSDPFIGASVNALAREGALVTIANPVALYFDSFQPVGFVTPDGTDASTFWKWTRGENGFHVRAVFEVPPEKGYTVGDIRISGKGRIRWGSMLADYIQIRLVGLACNIDPANVKPVQGCKGDFLSSSALLKAASPNASGKQLQLTRGRGSTDPIVFPDDISDDEQVLRKVMGIDDEITPMDPEEAAGLLQDPFAKLVLLSTPAEDRPQTLDQLSKVILQASGPDFEGLSFFVGDGSQIPFASQPDLDREFRFVWVRSLKNGSAEVRGDILIVSGTDTNNEGTLLQVASWDSVNRVFNFYARTNSAGDGRDQVGTVAGPRQWVWNGSSLHAFDSCSRGKGVFDGHVNGALVMKELRLPWNNWHSSNARIELSAIGPDDPLRKNPFFVNRELADDLEQKVIRPGIQAWTESRLEKAFQSDGSMCELPQDLLQHVFTTTTVNLISSPEKSVQKKGGAMGVPKTIHLPQTFFCNTFAFEIAFSENEDVNISTKGRFEVPYERVYIPTIDKFDFALVGNDLERKRTIRIRGDTFHAFLVPEPSEEDRQVMFWLVNNGVLSFRFLTCALMVDFHNPIYSPRRMDLMRFVPETGTKTSLEADVVSAILVGAANGNAAAIEFKRWYDVEPEMLAAEAASEIEEYLKKVDALCKTVEGFEAYTRLAHSRRLHFKGTELNEFSLTLPSTNIEERDLQMAPDGTVTQMRGADALKVATKSAKAKCPGISAGLLACPFAK